MVQKIQKPARNVAMNHAMLIIFSYYQISFEKEDDMHLLKIEHGSNIGNICWVNIYFPSLMSRFRQTESIFFYLNYILLLQPNKVQ